MQLILALVIFLFSINCAFAEDKVESSQVKLKYKCTLLSEIDKEFSQGYLAPTFHHGIGDVIVDGKGIVHYYGSWKNKKLNLLANHKTISRMSRTAIDNMFSALAIDNVLYMIDERGEEEGAENQVKWQKELKSPIKGVTAWLENKLAVLTIDNHLYVLDVQNGDLIWSYSNGINEIMGLHSVSPVIASNMVVVPFSNGELIAFDENGKRLWSYKFPLDLLVNQFTDITTTPEVVDNLLIATNNSTMVALDVQSGNPVWSKSMQVKNMSVHRPTSIIKWPPEIELRERSIIATSNNEVTKINPSNGEVIWNTKLSIKGGKPIYGGRYGNYFIVSDNGIMFLFNEKSGIVEEKVIIPEGVHHHITLRLPPDNMSAYFTTEKKGVYFCKDTLLG